MAIYINGSAVAYGTAQTGGIEQVAVLPSSGDVDHLYYLTTKNGTYEVGLYYWNGTSWISTGTGSGSGTTNYSELTNKPKINNIELTGNKTYTQLDIAQASTTYTKTQVDTLISSSQKVYIVNDVPTAANNVGLYYVGDGTSAYEIYLVDTAKTVSNLGSATISLDGYQKQDDPGLITDDQTVVGGINELKTILNGMTGGGTILLNDTAVTGDYSFYAPLESGTYGWFLMSQGPGNPPIWQETSVAGTSLKLNGNTNVASEATIWAPTTGGTAGQALISQGENMQPTWTDLATGGSTVTLNDVSYANKLAKFYAPVTKSTTVGQCVISQANGIPTWGNKSYVVASTTGTATDKVNYLTIDNKEWKVGGTSVTASETGTSTTEAKYLTIDNTEYKLAGGNSEDTILNGETVTGTLEFYAPTRAGAQNAIIVSNGPGIAPSWKTSLRTVSLTRAQYNALSDVEKQDATVMYIVTGDEDTTDFFDLLYPVNSIYWSTATSIPNNFRGTWSKLGTTTSIISGTTLVVWKRTA